jgi:hypothetical protein
MSMEAEEADDDNELPTADEKDEDAVEAARPWPRPDKDEWEG